MKLTKIALAVVIVGQLFGGLVSSSADSPTDYEAAAKRYVDEFRGSASDPRPMAYPQLAEVAASLFEPEAIALDFSTIETLTNGSKKTTAGSIWYSKGKIFIEYSAVPEGETPWSYATVGERLLGWKHGDSKLTSFKRYPGDTVDFLWYMTDISAIKASLHFRFLEKPEAFNIVDSPPWRRLVLRQPVEGFSELAIRVSPLWLREVVYKDPTRDAAEVRIAVDAPRMIDSLPERLEGAIPNVGIEPTDRTIKSRMSYL